MPCSIRFLTVNGIVPPGQTNPTLLRVTGESLLCQSNQVQVTSSITAASGPVPLDPATGRFRVDLPITSTPSPNCGDIIRVRAECIGSVPPCFVEDATRRLTCCEIGTLFFDARVPLGNLAPTALVVRGTLLGCPTDQVILSASRGPVPVTATSPPIAVDQYDGSFNATLTITAPVSCDDDVSVTATCASNPACRQTVRARLFCVGCYRATVTQTPGTCTGTPPAQPITLDATINIAAGQTMTFLLDFGDGTSGPPFTVNNSTGTATTPHTHSETHNYSPGTYTATLRVVPPPFECDEVAVTVVAQCASCPTITLGPPMIATQCVGGKRTVTLASQITAAPGQLTVVQWDFGDGSLGPATVINAGATVPYQETHDYTPPGPYTARLRVVVPQAGCPDTPVQVSLTPCPPPPCTLLIQNIILTVGLCNPATSTRTVTATAVLNNTDPTDLYWWQWDANPAQVGLPAPQGVTQQHDYPAPGPGQSTETVKLVVTRGVNRDCVASLSMPVTLDPCAGDCPTIDVITHDAPGVCTTDRHRRTVTLGATISGPAVSQYEWTFGDGAAQTLPGSAGPSTTHEYAPGTYTVRLTAIGPGNCRTFREEQITVTACCPEARGIGVAPGSCPPGATVRPVTLNAQVAGTGVSQYEWEFGDGSPNFGPPGAASTPPHNYTAPGTYTARVTVRAPNCPDSTTSTTVNVAGCPADGGGSISCAVLLWAAIVSMLVGAILVVLGCLLSTKFPTAAFVLMVIGGALFGLGWLLFLIWLWLCSSFTECAVLLAVRRFVILLIAIFAVVAAVIAIIALFSDKSLWPCAAAAAAFGFNWGGVLAILDGVAQARGCLIENPTGASSGDGANPASDLGRSSELGVSAMSSTGRSTRDSLGATMLRATQTLRARARRTVTALGAEAPRRTRGGCGCR